MPGETRSVNTSQLPEYRKLWLDSSYILGEDLYVGHCRPFLQTVKGGRKNRNTGLLRFIFFTYCEDS